MAKDTINKGKLVRLMLCFFIVGNILNLVAYNLWDKLDQRGIQITLGVTILVAIVFGILAYKRIGGVLDYLSYLAISLLTSYIPCWLIHRYTNGGSYRLYIICGILYNLMALLAIILSYRKVETGNISIIVLVVTILVFGSMIVFKDSSLLAAIAGYVPSDHSIWSNEILIIALFNIGMAIIQYVGLMLMDEEIQLPFALVLSFLLVFGLAVTILLAVISGGECGSDCSGADCGALDCGSGSSEDKNKKAN